MTKKGSQTRTARTASMLEPKLPNVADQQCWGTLGPLASPPGSEVPLPGFFCGTGVCALSVEWQILRRKWTSSSLTIVNNDKWFDCRGWSPTSTKNIQPINLPWAWWTSFETLQSWKDVDKMTRLGDATKSVGGPINNRHIKNYSLTAKSSPILKHHSYHKH